MDSNFSFSYGPYNSAALLRGLWLRHVLLVSTSCPLWGNVAAAAVSVREYELDFTLPTVH